MSGIDWQLAAAIATVLSSVTFAASAIAVVMQLRQTARGHFFSVTAHLFEIWQSPDFQHDQLFLLHKLGRPSWDEFCAGGRGELAERAIHRVGGYYDRVGTLVLHNLINKEEILPTIGGYAVAVWYKIQPLVKELRLRENAVLFQNFELLLPECHECYVPGIEHWGGGGDPPAAGTGVTASAQVVRDIPARLNGESTTVGNTASTAEHSKLDPTIGGMCPMAPDNMTFNGQTLMAPDFALPDSDGVTHRLSEFTAVGPAVVVYARGAHCPFCLRQLADYGEKYGDFRRAGLEVVALSPESPRRSRRLRTTLKLPFAVLCDAKFEVAKTLGLMDHEKKGMPTPATLIIDSQRQVRMSTLNDYVKCLVARDVLEYGRAMEKGHAASILPPTVEMPKPGWLFLRGLANLAVGLVSR